MPKAAEKAKRKKNLLEHFEAKRNQPNPRKTQYLRIEISLQKSSMFSSVRSCSRKTLIATSVPFQIPRKTSPKNPANIARLFRPQTPKYIFRVWKKMQINRTQESIYLDLDHFEDILKQKTSKFFSSEPNFIMFLILILQLYVYPHHIHLFGSNAVRQFALYMVQA